MSLCWLICIPHRNFIHDTYCGNNTNLNSEEKWILVSEIILNNLIFFMFSRFPAILLVKAIDSYLHEFCARGILHSDFQ